MHIDLAGFYTARRVALDGTVRQELGPFHNDITDNGLDRLGTGAAMARAYVGTGTTPPTPLDPGMAAWLASTSAVEGSPLTERDPTNTLYWVQQTRTFRFAAGTATGNITEVGIGWANSNTTPAPNTLWSRQLIRDGSGNPTTITVLADEFLDVSYTVRFYPDLTTRTAAISITGPLAGTHTVTVKPYALLNATVTQTGNFASIPLLDPVTNYVEQPAASSTSLGGSAGTASGVADTYVAGSYKRTTTHTLALNQGNVANGISGASLSPSSSATSFLWFRVQMKIDPPIMKTADRMLALRSEFSWGRYTP